MIWTFRDHPGVIPGVPCDAPFANETVTVNEDGTLTRRPLALDPVIELPSEILITGISDGQPTSEVISIPVSGTAESANVYSAFGAPAIEPSEPEQQVAEAEE